MEDGREEGFGKDLAPFGADMISVARSSIRHGLSSREPLPVSVAQYAPVLGTTVASFVTLRRNGDLRGCIGTAVACRPLIEDVSHNGYMAAFHDPRFAPLTVGEFGVTDIEVSVLGPPVPLPFSDEADLLSRLVPGRDGLVLEHGAQRGLFLPQVWETLPDPAEFLRHLKQKADLSDGPLGPGVRACRFMAVKFADDVAR